MPSAVFPQDTVPKDIGKTIAEVRRGRRWSQNKLASKSGIARASVYRVEGGDHPIRPDTLYRIAHALCLDMRDLVPDWPEREPLGSGGHGPRTRERRRELCMSLAELAKAAGVSEATLSRHERCIGSSPSLVESVGDRQYACSSELAQALGFSGIGEFELYCRGRVERF